MSKVLKNPLCARSLVNPASRQYWLALYFLWNVSLQLTQVRRSSFIPHLWTDLLYHHMNFVTWKRLRFSTEEAAKDKTERNDRINETLATGLSLRLFQYRIAPGVSEIQTPFRTIFLEPFTFPDWVGKPFFIFRK